MNYFFINAVVKILFFRTFELTGDILFAVALASHQHGGSHGVELCHLLSYRHQLGNVEASVVVQRVESWAETVQQPRLQLGVVHTNFSRLSLTRIVQVHESNDPCSVSIVIGAVDYLRRKRDAGAPHPPAAPPVGRVVLLDEEAHGRQEGEVRLHLAGEGAGAADQTALAGVQTGKHLQEERVRALVRHYVYENFLELY